MRLAIEILDFGKISKMRRLQLRVFGVFGVWEARTGAGIVGGRVGVRLSAGSGPPSRSVLL